MIVRPTQRTGGEQPRFGAPTHAHDASTLRRRLRDAAVLLALAASVSIGVISTGCHDLAAEQTVGLQSRAYRSQHESQGSQQHSSTQCAPKNAPGEVHRCDDDARETDFVRRLRRKGE